MGTKTKAKKLTKAQLEQHIQFLESQTASMSENSLKQNQYYAELRNKYNEAVRQGAELKSRFEVQRAANSELLRGLAAANARGDALELALRLAYGSPEKAGSAPAPVERQEAKVNDFGFRYGSPYAYGYGIAGR